MRVAGPMSPARVGRDAAMAAGRRRGVHRAVALPRASFKHPVAGAALGAPLPIRDVGLAGIWTASGASPDARTKKNAGAKAPAFL